VPQQALFAMNSAFVIEQAKSAAARALGTEAAANTSESAAAIDPATRVDAIYRTVLGRSAGPDELLLAEQFLAEASTAFDANSADAKGDEKNEHLAPLEQLAQVLLATNEFLFVD
jgi:hypothetical protein